VSDPAGTHVHDPQGAAHTGSGDIVINQWLSEARGSEPRRQALDELTWIAQRFVHPQGFGRARDILISGRAVFLDAPPGSGRVAAAKELLWELRDGAERFHELLPLEDEDRLDLSLVGAGDRIWLDLSGLTGPEWGKIRDELSSLRTVVLDRSAYLVVVLPSAAEGLPAELTQFRALIESPPAHEVLSRHLRCAGLTWPGTLPPQDFLSQGKPLGDIPEFVDLIVMAREQAHGLGDLAAWCETAYRLWQGRRAEVGDQVSEFDGDGQKRALLLVTAMLHGAHADAIHEGTQDLLKIAQHPPDGTSMLQGVPLSQRLKEIRADIDAACRVQFDDPGYDKAVRAFFWKNSPELHDLLGRWVAQIADSATLRLDGDLESLARRFGEQCRAERYRSSWVPLVERWTGDTAHARQMSAAALILRDGLEDKRHGRVFRRQIYQWAKSFLTERLAAVIVEVCRDEMAVNHPDEALVRLHHVARRERGTLAQAALVDLARSDRRFFRQLLSRLADQSPERRWLAADVEIFLLVTEPRLLTEPGEGKRTLSQEAAVQRWLIAGWQFAFAQPPQKWCPPARQWLDHAAHDEAHQHDLLDVLIAAARSHTATIALLFTLRDRRQDAGFGKLLLQKISAAQGLSFA
jgi:hypothetical protein